MLELNPFPQPTAQSTTDMVFDALYKAVVQLDLPPGSRLSEAEVAERLQVSRQPVRDAFFRLASRGFLSIRPQRATLVTKISEAEVLHAAFIRIALETACMKEVIARISDDDLARLQSLLAAQAEAAARSDSGTFHALDEAFHAQLCQIGGQPKLWRLIHEQKGHMDRARYLSLSFNQAMAHAEHMEIFAALTARDATAAVTRLEAHLNKIRTHLDQIRRDHSAYFEQDS